MKTGVVWKKKLSGVIREVCGYIKGKPRRVKTWWWDREVDVAVSRKRDLFIYLLFGKENYWENWPARKAVEKVDSCHDGRELFITAKQWAREIQYVIGVNCLKDESVVVKVGVNSWKQTGISRWQHCCLQEGRFSVQNWWWRSTACNESYEKWESKSAIWGCLRNAGELLRGTTNFCTGSLKLDSPPYELNKHATEIVKLFHLFLIIFTFSNFYIFRYWSVLTQSPPKDTLQILA